MNRGSPSTQEGKSQKYDGCVEVEQNVEHTSFTSKDGLHSNYTGIISMEGMCDLCTFEGLSDFLHVTPLHFLFSSSIDSEIKTAVLDFRISKIIRNLSVWR